MSYKSVFPEATHEDKQLGWNFRFSWLQELREKSGASLSLDDLDTVLVYAQADALLAMSAPIAENERMKEGLHELASWGEGELVTGSFDCPACARVARSTLNAIGIWGPAATSAHVPEPTGSERNEGEGADCQKGDV
jgi:hypothetical protein